jgi:hypothetical protein
MPVGEPCIRESVIEARQIQRDSSSRRPRAEVERRRLPMSVSVPVA